MNKGQYPKITIVTPVYNNVKFIEDCIVSVLNQNYPNLEYIVIDGGSTDDTREVAKEFEIKPWQEKIVSIYRGPAGKGSAFRSIFEAAKRLKVEACMVVDSDLRSITGEWVKYLLEPVLEKDYQYVEIDVHIYLVAIFMCVRCIAQRPGVIGRRNAQP